MRSHRSYSEIDVGLLLSFLHACELQIRSMIGSLVRRSAETCAAHGRVAQRFEELRRWRIYERPNVSSDLVWPLSGSRYEIGRGAEKNDQYLSHSPAGASGS
jgi:hypothetical protein